MRDEEVPPAADFGFAPDPWFDGVDVRPSKEDADTAPVSAALPVLLEHVEGRPLEVSAPAVLVRKTFKSREAVVLDYPYPDNRSGRKQCDVEQILAIGGVGHLLLRAVVQQCAGKSPGGWKVHLRAIIYVAQELAGRGEVFEDGSALPVDTLLGVERRLSDKGGSLTQAASGYLRAAGRVVRRVPGTEHVEFASFNGDDGGSDPNLESEDDLEAPTDVEIEDLIKLAMRRVLGTMAEDAQVRSSSANRAADGPLDPALARAAAFMRQHHFGGPPSIVELRMLQPGAASAIDALDYAKVRRAAYPSVDDMLPFLVLLAFYTRLNPSVLCGIRLDQIERTNFMGQSIGAISNEYPERIEMTPFKPRQGRRQHVSFAITAEPDNPDTLITFLQRWTEGIRTSAGASSDRLFIFAHKGNKLKVGDFVFDSGAFAENMCLFCWQAGIRPMTPKQLRPAAVDLIFQASGGDMALVRASGWWRSVSTPERVYLGPRTRRRGEEDLAFQRVLEERRRRFGIDVANRPRWMDRGAATPGWTCYDPFSGPLRTKRGELCSAVGLCPLCPNADLDSDSPEAFAWVVALGLALLGKREVMPEEHWRAKWEPVLDGLLTDWIPLFAQEVVDEARLLPAVSIEDF